MQAASKIFHDYLKKRELKNTPERFLILNQIIKMQHHFEADSLLVQLKIKNKKISRATIYRTLDLLVDCGLVKKIYFDTTHAFYEPVSGLTRHDHFVCLDCGKIIEFYDRTINKIQRNLQAVHGLEVFHYSYHLSGRCAACRKKAKRLK
jgi:Fur family ferric uptake transcriptional regulator